MVNDCKGKVDEKDRDINDLRASINSLERMVFDRDEDIIQRGPRYSIDFCSNLVLSI